MACRPESTLSVEGNLEFGWAVPLTPYFCSTSPLELVEIRLLQNTILGSPFKFPWVPPPPLAMKMDGLLLVAF